MAKVAVVTGGVGALGSAVSARFAHEGYDVFVSAVKDAEKARYGGPGRVDVVDLTDLSATREWASGMGGPIHAAALIAGGFAMKGIVDIEGGDFERMFDLNAKTAFNTLASLTPHLSAGAGVVLVGAAAFGGAAGMSLYAASKAAVVSLARSAALELQDRRIRVNSILPNIMDTPANRAAMPNADYDKWAKVEEVAEAIYFLCSEGASVVSGNAINLGRTIP